MKQNLQIGIVLIGIVALVSACGNRDKTPKAPPPMTKVETSRLEELTQKVEKEGLKPLSKGDVPIFLKKGEEAYFVASDVELFEEKAVRKSTRGEGVGLSIRLVKGVSLHPGLFQSHPVIEREMTKVADGKLVVTSKRIVFVGSERNISADYKKILGVTPYAAGFEVEREGKKARELIKTADPVTPLVYVTYIINHLSDE